MSALDVLIDEAATTLRLGMARGADVDELASDVVYELLEGGSDDGEQHATLFVALRTALKESRA